MVNHGQSWSKPWSKIESDVDDEQPKRKQEELLGMDEPWWNRLIF
jgi:hypothetical protein